jgi:hypothetical protein
MKRVVEGTGHEMIETKRSVLLNLLGDEEG